MNIDYNAVIEILKSFLNNDKTEISGISVGEERQVKEAIKNLLTAYEKEKGLEEKIKKYINIIQKELDKYKIKNTNTYLQIEGNPEISELLIQKATLEELIKEE